MSLECHPARLRRILGVVDEVFAITTPDVEGAKSDGGFEGVPGITRLGP